MKNDQHVFEFALMMAVSDLVRAVPPQMTWPQIIGSLMASVEELSIDISEEGCNEALDRCRELSEMMETVRNRDAFKVGPTARMQ